MAMLGLAAEDDDGNAATASANGKGAAPGVTGPVSTAQAEEIRQAIVETAADLPRFLATFGIALLVVWIPLGFLTVWFIYRVVRGWSALSSNQPMYT